MPSFDNAFTLFLVVMVALVLAFWGLALRNFLIGRRNARLAEAARVAARIETLKPVGLSAFEGADAQAIAWAARREIMRVLAAKPFAVLVSENAVPALIEPLRAMRYPAKAPAHTQPPLSAWIETAAGRIELWLARDGENARDYWVFHPGLEVTRAHALGVISTDLLDAIAPLAPAGA